MVEAIRDPGEPDSSRTFLMPMEERSPNDADEGPRPPDGLLCLRCGAFSRGNHVPCGHPDVIRVLEHTNPDSNAESRSVPKCGSCGYTGGSRDPVTELVHGADGPHSVIVTTLCRELARPRRKVLAFADGRREAAFFAWYMQTSYESILERNLLLRALRQLADHGEDGLTIADLATEVRPLLGAAGFFLESEGGLEQKRRAWSAVYREFLTEETRIALEGVAAVEWFMALPQRFKVPQVLLQPPWSLTEPEARQLTTQLLGTLRYGGAVELAAEKDVTLDWASMGFKGQQARCRLGGGNRPPVERWDSLRGRRGAFLRKLLLRVSGCQCDEDIEGALIEMWEAVRECDHDAGSDSDRLLVRNGDAARLNPRWWRARTLAGPDEVFRCDSCGRVYARSVRGMCPRHGCDGTLQRGTVDALGPNHYRALYEDDLPGLLRVEEHTAQLATDKAARFQRDFRTGKIQVLSCSTTFELGVDLGDLDTVFLRNVPPESFNYMQRVGRAGRRRDSVGFAVTYCRRSPHDLYHFSDPVRIVAGRTKPPSLSLHNDKIILRHLVAVALSEFFRAHPERFGRQASSAHGVESFVIDLLAPDGCASVLRYLEGNEAEILSRLARIMPPGSADSLGLGDGSWLDHVAGESSRLALAEAELSSDYSRVKEFERESSEKGRHDLAKWAQTRGRTIASESVLSFLSRKAVLPKYGFPVDVVELETSGGGQYGDVLLQRDLRMAIAEYAPGSSVVANKNLWTSHFVKKVAGKEWPERAYAVCRTHGVLGVAPEGSDEVSLGCGCPPGPLRKYIVPMFGFTTGRSGPTEPHGRPSASFTTRPYFLGLRRDDGQITFPERSAKPLVSITKAAPGEMLVLCQGHKARLFFVCPACGAGFTTRKTSHEDAFGRSCRGTLKPVALGHSFVTDVVRLDFHVPGPSDAIAREWFGHSLAYALLEGAAEALQVPSTDLNVVVTYRGSAEGPSMVLYDDVPGGAGLVARLESEEVLRESASKAYQRVEGRCGCDSDSSCYGCLRTYRNQFAHHGLRRGPVKEYLATMLGLWDG